VAVCAKEDIDSPHVTGADEHVVVDGEGAIGPYLNIQGLTVACVERGVDLVHPGEFCCRQSFLILIETCIDIERHISQNMQFQIICSATNQVTDFSLNQPHLLPPSKAPT
jgi:biotin carboxylase